MDKSEKIINIIVMIGLSIIFMAMIFVFWLIIDFIKEVKYHPCVYWAYQNNQVHCLERLDLTDK